jgi:hypothetical protein
MNKIKLNRYDGNKNIYSDISFQICMCVVGGETSSHLERTYSEYEPLVKLPLCYVKALACRMLMSHIPLLLEACSLFQISLRYINMGWTHPA